MVFHNKKWIAYRKFSNMHLRTCSGERFPIQARNALEKGCNKLKSIPRSFRMEGVCQEWGGKEEDPGVMPWGSSWGSLWKGYNPGEDLFQVSLEKHGWGDSRICEEVPPMSEDETPISSSQTWSFTPSLFSRKFGARWADILNVLFPSKCVCIVCIVDHGIPKWLIWLGLCQLHLTATSTWWHWLATSVSG